jgi:hypothetical protein
MNLAARRLHIFLHPFKNYILFLLMARVNDARIWGSLPPTQLNSVSGSSASLMDIQLLWLPPGFANQ